MTRVVACVALLTILVCSTAHARSGHAVELGASFDVRNSDTSGVTCPSDGASYVVHGHLTEPAGSRTRTISVYLTGLETGEWNWRLTSVAGYDWPAQMASAGDASLTLDMLGYGQSGHPNGDFTCYGSQADVVHQLVTELRSGHYRLDGGARVRFDRVVLVGHDVGGTIAQIEAYSYEDVDGLVVVTWADQGQTPLLDARAVRASALCTAGGDPAQPAYFYMERAGEYRDDLFYNADPAVIAAFVRLRERNPCGYMSSALPAIATDLARLREVHVPVLLAIGAQDKIFTQDGWALQREWYAGTRDVTAVSLPDTGHYPMLERSAPRFRALVAAWLERRGLGR